jgi:hypothetical protein
MAVRAKRAGGRGSSMAMIVTGDLPELLESEPNDEHDQGTSVTLPCAISGIFQNARDADCYEFAVSKAERLDITSYGRSLGTPAYAFLQLYDEQDKLLVESDVTDSDELTLTHTPAADGMLRLVVRDLVNRGGARYAYRVEIRCGPDFSLTLQQEKETQLKYAVPANGGHIALNVQAQRRGYQGPIQLELEPPSSQFQLYNATIPAGANEVTLHLATPDNLTASDFQVLRIRGRADCNGREIQRDMHTATTLRAKFPLMPYPPHALDGFLATVATAAQLPLFATTAEQDSVNVTQGAEPCEYEFEILRTN